jgi:hypothetical protein
MADETSEELKRRLETRVLRAAHGALDIGERLWRLYKFVLKLIRYFFLTIVVVPLVLGVLFAGWRYWNFGSASSCDALRQLYTDRGWTPEGVAREVATRERLGDCGQYLFFEFTYVPFR